MSNCIAASSKEILLLTTHKRDESLLLVVAQKKGLIVHVKLPPLSSVLRRVAVSHSSARGVRLAATVIRRWRRPSHDAQCRHGPDRR